MKTVIIFFLFCFLCLHVYATDSLLLAKYPKRYYALKIGTGELIPTNPMLQFAFEKRMDKIGVQVGLGFCVPKSYVVDGVNGKADGYTVRLEARLYPFKLKTRPFVSPYFGCELYYKEYKRPMTGYFEHEEPHFNYEDEYILHKSMYCAAGKAGFELRFARHFLFDVSLGLGVKKVNITHTERQYPDDRKAWVLRESFFIIDNQPDTEVGEKLDVALPFNISIGYFFH